MADVRKLTRSESDRMVAGVGGGLAVYLGVDPTIVRVALVLLAVLGGSGVVLYLAMWLLMPRESQVDTPPREVARDGFDEGMHLARKGVDEGRKLARDGITAARRTFGKASSRRTDTSAGDGSGEDPGSPERGEAG